MQPWLAGIAPHLGLANPAAPAAGAAAAPAAAVAAPFGPAAPIRQPSVIARLWNRGIGTWELTSLVTLAATAWSLYDDMYNYERLAKVSIGAFVGTSVLVGGVMRTQTGRDVTRWCGNMLSRGIIGGGRYVFVDNQLSRAILNTAPLRVCRRLCGGFFHQVFQDIPGSMYRAAAWSYENRVTTLLAASALFGAVRWWYLGEAVPAPVTGGINDNAIRASVENLKGTVIKEVFSGPKFLEDLAFMSKLIFPALHMFSAYKLLQRGLQDVVLAQQFDDKKSYAVPLTVTNLAPPAHTADPIVSTNSVAGRSIYSRVAPVITTTGTVATSSIDETMEVDDPSYAFKNGEAAGTHRKVKNVVAERMAQQKRQAGRQKQLLAIGQAVLAVWLASRNFGVHDLVANVIESSGQILASAKGPVCFGAGFASTATFLHLSGTATLDSAGFGVVGGIAAGLLQYGLNVGVSGFKAAGAVGGSGVSQYVPSVPLFLATLTLSKIFADATYPRLSTLLTITMPVMSSLARWYNPDLGLESLVAQGFRMFNTGIGGFLDRGISYVPTPSLQGTVNGLAFLTLAYAFHQIYDGMQVLGPRKELSINQQTQALQTTPIPEKNRNYEQMLGGLFLAGVGFGMAGISFKWL